MAVSLSSVAQQYNRMQLRRKTAASDTSDMSDPTSTTVQTGTQRRSSSGLTLVDSSQSSQVSAAMSALLSQLNGGAFSSAGNGSGSQNATLAEVLDGTAGTGSPNSLASTDGQTQDAGSASLASVLSANDSMSTDMTSTGASQSNDALSQQFLAALQAYSDNSQSAVALV